MGDITDLQFQIIGSSAKDVFTGGIGHFQITLFGVTAEGYSVSLAVTGFKPFFFVEIPDSWSQTDIQGYKSFLLNSLTNKKQQSCVTLTIEHHKSFWDFTNNRMFKFLKIQATSKQVWKKLCFACLSENTSIPIPYKGQVLRVYESNIDPILRFFHICDIRPADWVRVEEAFWEDDENAKTTTSIQATAEYEFIKPADKEKIKQQAPLSIMSWDIECSSSHGDFPQATKTWRKPAREIVESAVTNWIDALESAVQCIDGPLSYVYVKDKDRSIVLEYLHALKTHTEKPVLDITNIDAVETFLNSMSETEIEGDPIIQIGSVLYMGGKPSRKDVFVLGTCTSLPTCEYPTFIHPCKTESGVIKGWCALIQKLDPDIMVGYNIFGFDDKYLWDRAEKLNLLNVFDVFSRSTAHPIELQKSNLSSSAIGDNTFYILSGDGRLHIDLMAYVKRNAILDSYSLDNVTATFMSGSVISVKAEEEKTMRITTKSTKGTIPGRSIVLMDEDNDVIGDKLEVVSMTSSSLLVRGTILHEHLTMSVRWSQSKDDISPKDIFDLHKNGGADGRAKIAKYCLQDCDLVVELMMKLDVMNNSIAMANVCWVPVDYIFTRGQGIKSESLVFYECRKENQLIPVLPQKKFKQTKIASKSDSDQDPDQDQEGYEGAIVLDPITGFYTDDDPVGVLDFSSLYPSSEISENMSHDSVVSVKDYDLKGNFVRCKEGSDMYDNLPDWEYLNQDYDIFTADPKDTRKHPKLVRTGVRVCRFAQSPDPQQKSTLPKIIQKLLARRKAVRKLAESEPDEFRRALMDAEQLAYKTTANSLYGQLGSNTSKIRRKCLAASTTAHARQQIMFSKACIEAIYGPAAADPRCAACCVYGDTDSLFIAFRPKNPLTGERLRGKEAQIATKALALEAGHKISGALKPPHDFEFDKMFRSFCLLSKKRYVGDMTEDGTEDKDYHRKSMGIVMKRRDNAPIVKYMYGGVIEQILTHNDVAAAFHFVRAAIREMLAGKFPLRRLTLTKSLRAEYLLVPAHKILADRIKKRDPGNKISSNDRIPFVYVMMPNGKSWPKDTHQGDRIETPTYLNEHGLKPDFVFYITNQIAKPVAQIFGLVLERIPGFKAQSAFKDRDSYAEELLFGDLVRDAQRDAAGQRDLRSFFKS